MRTHRLDLDDATLREWDAIVVHTDADGVVLDRSAFYPGGGGQPPDHGVLIWGGVQTRIVGTRKGDEQYLIPAEDDPLPPVGTAVRGALDDLRRTALMRTHSAMHLLCGVVSRDFGVPVTGHHERRTAYDGTGATEGQDARRDLVEKASGLTVDRVDFLRRTLTVGSRGCARLRDGRASPVELPGW